MLAKIRNARFTGYVAALALVLSTIGLFKLVPGLTDTADVVLLLTVFLTASIWESGPAILAAITAPLAFHYFFGQFRRASPRISLREVAAFAVFLLSALVVGRLSALARKRMRQIDQDRKDLAQLAELSRSFLADTNREKMPSLAADRIRRVLNAGSIAIYLSHEGAVYEEFAATSPVIARKDLIETVLREGKPLRERTGAGGTDVYLPIQTGMKIAGVLCAFEMRGTQYAAEACCALIGLAVEREKFIILERQDEMTHSRDEMKSTLLATLAHDLKTPLATANGVLENWIIEAGLTERSRLARDSMQRLMHLIEELLQVIKLEAGVAHPAMEKTMCGEIIEAAIARHQDALAGHPLSVDITPPNLAIVADAAQLSEALSLGLENAALHTAGDSEIFLTAQAVAGGVLLQVSDNGPGIPAEHRERALEKFVRLRNGAGIPGNGLGLYIAKSLVALNNGKLTLSASATGGTSFEIFIPETA